MSRLPDIQWDSPDSGSTSQDDSSPNLKVSLPGDSATIPIVYGEAMVPALTQIVTTYEGDLVILAVWCVGRIEAIDALYVNDVTITTNVIYTNYTGTVTQTPDPLLALAVPGYADALVYISPTGVSVGIAYTVFRIPPTESLGFPRLTAKIRGRLVSNMAGGIVYSANPVLCLADLLSDPVIGRGQRIDSAAALSAAALCDAVVGTRPRRALGLVIGQERTIESWVEILRSYANVVLAIEGDLVKIIANNEFTSPVTTITADQVIDKSFDIQHKQAGRTSTACTVEFTDHSVTPFATNYYTYTMPEVVSGGIPLREQTLSMPGIPNRAQAAREAVETIRRITLAPFIVRWTTTAVGVSYAVGDRVTVQPPGMPAAMDLRIVQIDRRGTGRWDVTAEQISASVQDNSDYIDDPLNDVVPPDDYSEALLPPQSIVLSEIYNETSTLPHTSAIRAYWTSTVSSLRRGYYVSYQDAVNLTYSDEVFVNLEAWESGWLTVPLTYTVRVRSVAVNDEVGAYAYQTIALAGKDYNREKPSAVSTSGSGDCFSVFARPFEIHLLWWFPPGIADLKATEIYYSAVPSASTVQHLATVAYPGNDYAMRGLGPGEGYYFFLRFVNTAGIPGDWHAINGTYGISSCNADVVLSYLSGQIEQTDLHTSLSTLIDDKLDPGSPAIVEMAATIDNLSAEWTVKIQSGNYVAGIGLAVYPEGLAGVQSDFLVNVDRFAVGHPTASPTPTYPFIIQNGITYLAKAMIGTAWIETAHINNLSVTNGKINWNAVTETVTYSEGYRWLNPDSYSFQAITNDVFVNMSSCYGVVVLAQVDLSHVNGTVGAHYCPGWARYAQLTMNGTVVRSVNGSLAGNCYQLEKVDDLWQWGWNWSNSFELVWSATWPVGYYGTVAFKLWATSTANPAFPGSTWCDGTRLVFLLLKK